MIKIDDTKNKTKNKIEYRVAINHNMVKIITHYPTIKK
jgi:hypothetical protein